MGDCDSLGEILSYVSLDGKTAEVERLIAKGAPIDWQNADGEGALHMASTNGHVDTVMLLIENKANVDIAAKYGKTPLMSAVMYNEMAVVRALVESSADVTMRGADTMTAAEIAKYHGYDAIAEYLTNSRFLPTARDESGRLFRVQGRANRASYRDLVDIAGFDMDMLGLMKQFCVGKR